MSPGLCFLPITSRVDAFMVCGFMLILVARCSLMDCSLALSRVSGLPASMVNSRVPVLKKLHSTLSKSLSSWALLKEVGVPPPI